MHNLFIVLSCQIVKVPTCLHLLFYCNLPLWLLMLFVNFYHLCIEKSRFKDGITALFHSESKKEMMFASWLILSCIFPYILLCNNPQFGNYFKKPDCGGYGSKLAGRSNRVWTLSSIERWPNQVVYYSYISDGSDDLKNDAVYVDSRVGINKALLNVKRNVDFFSIKSQIPNPSRVKRIQF